MFIFFSEKSHLTSVGTGRTGRTGKYCMACVRCEICEICEICVMTLVQHVDVVDVVDVVACCWVLVMRSATLEWCSAASMAQLGASECPGRKGSAQGESESDKTTSESEAVHIENLADFLRPCR